MNESRGVKKINSTIILQPKRKDWLEKVSEGRDVADKVIEVGSGREIPFSFREHGTVVVVYADGTSKIV